ncbi:hypothetical protein HK100_011940 [Physocladia obscura]|uniref:Transmembrane 9 superfamily member n=1 Tax=Physocladia obscura TaxID=109957 RepID=A0AAD5TAA5_9FUNG|nr:hypothetical protein HK100_011940 [Physocladia obscura]
MTLLPPLRLAWVWFALCLDITVRVHAYYLPGFPPQDYEDGDPVQLTVNALTSLDSRSLLPYDYYYEKFHFCTPDVLEVQRESLGSVLFGDRLHNSPFQLKMLKDEECVKLCTNHIKAEDAQFINLKIKEDYSMSWYVDNLPAAQVLPDDDGNSYYKIGFDLGALVGETEQNRVAYFYNHYDITIEYHANKDNNKFRVVGVIVTPRSVKVVDKTNHCNYVGLPPSLLLSEKQETEVSFYYNVAWKKSDTVWGTRWDKYLHVTDAQIHWFSIVNSIVIVLMLTGMIAMILLRALHKDISRYNSFIEEDGGQEDIGWKLVHADVFRPPQQRMLLSVLVGNGAQIFLMAGVTLLFAVLGFLSPSSRGALSTVTIIFYICFGCVAGYVSSRLYKMMQGEYWHKNVAFTALLVPGTIFLIFVTLNFVLISAQSSAAVPFTTMLALIALWFLISTPLCIVGAYFGFRQPTIENPVKTNQIPRQVPTQPAYLNIWASAAMGGILPFGAIFIELYFIMNSIWFHQIYYVFGFLFLVFLILVITSSEVAILMCYFHLCSEDWRWAWRSFLTAGCSGVYIFLHSAVYFFRKLRVDNAASGFLYFGWSLVMSMLFVILTGSVGYVSCLVFVRSIFGSIKVD